MKLKQEGDDEEGLTGPSLHSALPPLVPAHPSAMIFTHQLQKPPLCLSLPSTSLGCALMMEGESVLTLRPTAGSHCPPKPHTVPPSHLCSALATHLRVPPPTPAFSSCPEPSSTKEPSGTLSPDPASRFGTDTCSSPLLGKHLLYPQMIQHTQPPTSLSNHQCLPRTDLCQARGRADSRGQERQEYPRPCRAHILGERRQSINEVNQKNS